MGQLSLVFDVSIADADAHLLAVDLRVEAAAPLDDDLVLFMPVWSPGSYLVREYARHVEGVSATAGGEPATTQKVRKNAWRVACRGARQVRFSYRVFAGELTVRTNHVDRQSALVHGPATFVLPEGFEGHCKVRMRLPNGWVAKTSMPEIARDGDTVTFEASSVDDLHDSPILCGALEVRSFAMHGRLHEICVAPSRHAQAASWARVEADTRAIVEAEARLMAGPSRDPAEALPYGRFLFLWHVTPRARGGLEHCDSCVLMVQPHLFGTRSGYHDVLSLVAHEMLHLWNVKRIKPEGLVPYRYETECYTRQLWWFEGGTSYFDWRLLRLAGLCSPRDYTEHLASEIARMLDTPGALVHPLAEASFDAWIKAYRPDESSVNTTVSYYLKGEVVCALLDLEIRARSRGARSLDDVLRHLYWAYARESRAVPEGAMCTVMHEATGVDLADCFARWIDSADPVDVAPSLSRVGLSLERRTPSRLTHASLGVKMRSRYGRPVIDAPLRRGPAMRAGLDHGDEIIAIGRRRVEEGGLDSVLSHFSPGAEVEVHFVRDGFLESTTLVLDPPMPGEARLVVRDDAGPEARALLDGWLGDGAFAALRQGP